MKKARLAAVVCVLATTFVFILQPSPAANGLTCPDNAATAGCWLPPFSENGTFNDSAPDTEQESAMYPTAVSAAVLPNGKVVFWNGIEGSENLNGPLALSMPHPNTSRTRLLDISRYVGAGADPRTTASWSIPNPEDGGGGDLFCADQRHLADGRVLAVGGTDWQTVVSNPAGTPEGSLELFGRKNARIYDPSTNSWTQADNMHKGRWYPTMLTLPDGQLFVAGGVERLVHNYPGAPKSSPDQPDGTLDNVNETEVFNPATGAWKLNGPTGNQSLPLFARMHLLPNGKIFYDATGQMWGPAGQSVYQASWNYQKMYDPTTNSWNDVSLAPLGARSGTFSVMLPLRPPYNSAELLIGGGTLGTSPGLYAALNLVEKVTWSAAAPNTVSRASLPSLNNLRWYSSGVVLPTGEVLAFSGADRDEVILPGSEVPVRQPELWNPTTQTWTPLSSGSRDRTYHNSAVLLPDGSILVGGHSPIVNGYGQDHSTNPGFANNFKDPSFEIFKPPYLFRGTRPEFLTHLPKTLKRGSSYSLKVSGDMGDPSLKIVLSRLPATTHITDADQRTVDLQVGRRSSGRYFQLPSSASLITPGYYYAFAVRDNGQGPTPSHAQIVRVQ
jgi:hypothetical protein